MDPQPKSASWSAEHAIFEHKEIQASAIAVDNKGDHLLLAGRRAFAIVHLDNPNIIVKKMTRQQQRYDIVAAEWCPISSRSDSFAIGTGDRLEIYKWLHGSLVNELSVRGHTHNITDLNWHRDDPNLISTCSIDSSVQVWDTRDIRRPAKTFKALASAFRVRWNKQNSVILASAHDNDLRIWDYRDTTAPIRYVTAHLAKIYSLDWSPNYENQLVTSSYDCCVKIFDIGKPRKEETITTMCTVTPAWKTCYTPFGDGILTVLIPQFNRGENTILLWATQNTKDVSHTFIGPTDMVLGVDWRLAPGSAGSLNPEYEMLTWSRESVLRVWRINHHIQKLVGQKVLDVIDPGNDEDEYDFCDSLINDLCDLDAVEMKVTGPSPIYENSGISDIEYLKQSPSDLDVNPNIKVSIYNEFSTTEAMKMKPSPPHSLELSHQNQLEKSKVSESTDHHSSSSSSQHATPSTPSSQGRSTNTPVPSNLQQEFVYVVEQFQDSAIQVSTDIDKRVCQVTAKHGLHNLELSINCPSGYPKLHPLTFKFSFGTTLDPTIKNSLIKTLRSVAMQNLRKKRHCLDQCITALITTLNNFPTEDHSVSNDLSLGGSEYLGQMDLGTLDHVPFPRTSGARFCSSGLLVCFTRSNNHKKYNSVNQSLTPRSLSALPCLSKYPTIVGSVPTSPKYNYFYPSNHSPSDKLFSLSSYFYHEKAVKNKRGKTEEEKMSKRCVIYNVSALFPLSKELAAAYVLDDRDLVKSCYINRAAALTVGRKDLVQVWSIASSIIALSPSEGILSTGFPWASHPFAAKTINTLIDHYLKEHDIQTVAMLSCIFGIKNSSTYPSTQTRKGRIDTPSSGGSPYNTIHGINTGSDSWLGGVIRHNRSNSEGSLAESQRPPKDHDTVSSDQSNDIETSKITFLESSKNKQFDEIRKAYADCLYQWGFFIQRTMIQKYMQLSPPCIKGGEFQIECNYCGQIAKTPHCLYCNKKCFPCSICRVSIVGSSIFCIICGHGGHSNHMMDWFKSNRQCPTGCGCVCTDEMKDLFE